MSSKKLIFVLSFALILPALILPLTGLTAQDSDEPERSVARNQLGPGIIARVFAALVRR